MEFAFKKRDTLMCSLHPFTQLMIFLALVMIPLASPSPLSALAAIAMIAVLSAASEVFWEWLAWWRICAFISALTLVVNHLVSREGSTILLKGPVIPVLGRLVITAEAILYGAGMGLRISSVILSFALASLCVDPDRVLGFLSPATSGSALLTALTLRMVPTVARDTRELLETQTARGIVREEGSLAERMRSRLPILEKVLRTSLGKAISVAEAMESRAYGSGKRSRYLMFEFSGVDAAVCSSALAVCALWISSVALGWVDFMYYPSLKLGVAGGGIAAYGFALFASFMFFLASRLWKRTYWLKLRI